MALRGVSEAMVRDTVENPERTESGYGGRLVALRGWGTRLLKVVYVREGARVVIVTTIWEKG